MGNIGRRVRELRKAVETSGGPLSIEAAVSWLQSHNKSDGAAKSVKFDQTVELAVRLGIDPKQADQIVRGSVILPNGTGKASRVAVFAQGKAAEEAVAAGADVVGTKDLADRIKGGDLGFDVVICTPDLMQLVGPLGRTLGPRGLMPSPKAGTVTGDVATAVRQYKAGKVEFRNDSGGNVHIPVGKLSFSVASLIENVTAALQVVNSLRPQSAKGLYIRRVVVKATMMPALNVIPA